MDGCSNSFSFEGNFLQPNPECIIANGRNAFHGPNISLPNKVCDPKIVRYLNELNFAKLKWRRFLTTKPSSISLLGFRPTLGESYYEAASPPSNIIADMDDDSWPLSGRLRGIPDKVVNLAPLH